MGLIIYIFGLAIGFLLLLAGGVFIAPILNIALWFIAFIFIMGIGSAIWELIKPKQPKVISSTKNQQYIQNEISALRRLGRKG